jgi:DNA-binding transcriptional LysR family regulator
MDRLRCIEVFVEVARNGSFTGAAHRLGMSKASITKHVAWLESTLGVTLLNRTTKHARLTEAGSRALSQGQLLLQVYEDIETGSRQLVQVPRGIIRVGTPPSFGSTHLSPLAAQFTEMYPEIRVVLLHDDGSSNMITQGLDLALRIGPPPGDAGHVAVPLVNAPQVLVASEKYLRAHGTPRTPADLTDHNCLIQTLKSPTGIWRFTGRTGEVSVRVSGTIGSNFCDAIKNAAVAGHGVSMHPLYAVQEELKTKRLTVILPEYEPAEAKIYVVYPTRKNLPARTRHFIDYLKGWAKTPPDWSKPLPQYAVVSAE